MTRGPGSGRIEAQTRKGKRVYVAYWSGADGRRHMRALAHDKRTAEEMLAKIINERNRARQGMASEAGFEMHLSSIVDRYLIELAASRRPKHVDSVRRQLAKILDEFGRATQVRALSMARVLEYRRKALSGTLKRRSKSKAKDVPQFYKGASNRTCNAELGALKACLSWAVRVNMIGTNPIESLKPLSQQEADLRKRRRALTDDEIAAFLEASRTLDDERRKFYSAEKSIAGGTKGPGWNSKPRSATVPQTPLWWLLLERGLRWGEATLLRWADLDVERCRLTVRPATAKTKRLRMVPIPRSLVDAFEALRATHDAVLDAPPGPTDPIFRSRLGAAWKPSTPRNARAVLDEILKRAEIEKVDANGRSIDIHALRGTAATRLLRADVVMPAIVELFGWKDAKMLVRHYAHLRFEDTERAASTVPDHGSAMSSPAKTATIRRMTETTGI